jgi:hypothetical protein
MECVDVVINKDITQITAYLAHESILMHVR